MSDRLDRAAAEAQRRDDPDVREIATLPVPEPVTSEPTPVEGYSDAERAVEFSVSMEPQGERIESDTVLHDDTRTYHVQMTEGVGVAVLDDDSPREPVPVDAAPADSDWQSPTVPAPDTTGSDDMRDEIAEQRRAAHVADLEGQLREAKWNLQLVEAKQRTEDLERRMR